MLIEFSVSNYRSFRERQSFSMVAAPRLQKKENVFDPHVTGERLPGLLKVAAIYGPNASGKSNLLLALDVVQRILAASPVAGASALPIEPFRFDKDLESQPSYFELNFIAGKQRYQFELAVTSDRIVEERLIAFPAGKEALLYARRHTERGDLYTFGESLEGGSVLHEAWRNLTGPRTTFISQAVANSSEDYTQLRSPFYWLRGGLMIVNSGMSGYAESTQNFVKRFPHVSSELSSFLNELDVPITSVKVEGVSDELSSFANLASKKNMGLLRGLGTESKSDRTKTTLTHQTSLGEADFDFSEESEGTKGLIGFWMMWKLLRFEGDHYRCVVIDELDSSLHPEIVANLVRKHQLANVCTQLIFTTHDTHLMDTKLLRRDQFWVTERDASGATQLRSIHEFEGRESEDVEKRYFEGRYRGLPHLRQS